MPLSSRPARIPIVSTIGSALALQWVTFRRGLGRKYYRQSFQEFWFWHICAGMHVIVADILLTSGIFARLGPALEREVLSQNASAVGSRSVTAVDIAVILMCTLFALFTYTIYFSRFRQRVDLFLQVHAFSLCYDRCAHLDRLQMARMRLAQVIPLHADRFRYSFSGPTLVVTVGKREQIDCPSSLPSESLVQTGGLWSGHQCQRGGACLSGGTARGRRRFAIS
jgi:hypothetical protein